jgi:hypothetical protein
VAARTHPPWLGRFSTDYSLASGDKPPAEASLCQGCSRGRVGADHDGPRSQR